MRVNNFEHPGAVLASSHKINIENGCVQKNRQDKSLLDYYLEDERAEDIIPSFLYTKSGISQDLLNVKPLNYCEMAKAGYSFSENKLNSKDVWLTVDENGRQTTPYMKYNKDKVNYLVHYYLDRGGDMETYPFENDSEETQTAYKHLAEFYAYQALEESRLRSAFENSGIDSATITVDVKGEIKIESGNNYDSEKLDNLKSKLVESGKTATAFRNIIFREGQQYVGLSGEKKNEFSSMFYTGWILYRHYGLRVEDLAITEDGEIFGCPVWRSSWLICRPSRRSIATCCPITISRPRRWPSSTRARPRAAAISAAMQAKFRCSCCSASTASIRPTASCSLRSTACIRRSSLSRLRAIPMFLSRNSPHFPSWPIPTPGAARRWP